ncbi:MAG: hypothetical protein CMJ59_12665 [Planctomycetaceae bacterium]|nr:hypothetical protein [Planctomycetaceae bacterium]
MRLGTRAAMRLLALTSLIVGCLLWLAAPAAGDGLPTATPQQVGLSAKRIEQIDAVVQKFLDDKRLAGAVTIVARRGKVVQFRAYGMMDRAAGKPMRKETIFRIYSMTKAVASVAAMVLVEEGKLALDAPVSKYVPAVREMKVGAVKQAREMTVRDLLRHTAGFPNNVTVDRTFRAAGLPPLSHSTLAEMMSRLKVVPLRYQPGTGWHYSFGTEVLARVIEVAAGQSLDACLAERVFKPLGMQDTDFFVPAVKRDRLAVVYGRGLRVVDAPQPGTTGAFTFEKPPKFLSAGGGLVSTAADYMRFCLMLSGKGELHGKRLLKVETIEAMTRNQLPRAVGEIDRRPAGRGFGLGFAVRIRKIDSVVSSIGEYEWLGGAGTEYWLSPREELAVVTLTQQMPMIELGQALKPIVYGAIKGNDERRVVAAIGRLGDRDPRVRELASDTLATIGLRILDTTNLLPAVAPLVPLMNDADIEVRDETAEALGVIASRIKERAAVKSAIAALVVGLSDRSEQVREESAEALARIAGVIKDRNLLETAVEPLRKVQMDGGVATRTFARQALKSLGKDDPPPLKSPAQDVRRERYLLLDSRIIESKQNVTLTLGTVKKDRHNPLFVADKPWEPRYDNMYPNVIYDKQEQLYKCWYCPFIIDERTTHTPIDKRNPESTNYMKARPSRRDEALLYATSRDGIHWEKPELGIVEFGGNKQNNIVVRGPSGAGVFKDLRDPDPAKRYKAFYAAQVGFMQLVRFSPDGLHWGPEIPCPEIGIESDCHANMIWSPELEKYVGIVRFYDHVPIVGNRKIARTESTDAVKWTRASLAIEGSPVRQAHDMVIFRTGDVYLGLLGIMHYRSMKTNQGVRQHVELAWSPDSYTWHRIRPGTPLIDHTPSKERQYGTMPYDWGAMFPSTPVLLDREIRLYYGASDWYFFDWRKSGLALATLRPDGWAGYEPIEIGKRASIVTTPVVCGGDKLRLSADISPSGSIKVTLLAEDNQRLAISEPIEETATDVVVKWPQEGLVKTYKRTPIRLRFELENAKLYSFSFQDHSPPGHR